MSLSAVEQAAAFGLQQALGFLKTETFQVGSRSFTGNYNDAGESFELDGPGGKRAVIKGSIIAPRSAFTDWLPEAWTTLKRGGTRLLITNVVANAAFVLLTVGSETGK